MLCNALETVVLTEDFTAANLILVLDRVYSYTNIEFIIPEGNKTLVKDEFGIIYDAAKQIIYCASRCDVTGYVMPDTVMTIDKSAFRYCSGDKLIISENVKEIREKAFYYSRISSVYIPASVEVMGDQVFSYSEVKNVEFGKDSKLTYTGTYSFANTSNLESVVLPDRLALHQKSASSTSKPTYLFQNSSVKSVTFGAAVKEIPSSTFYGAKKIEEINFQEGLETINYLFYQSPTDTTALNYTLKSVTIPSTVKTLGAGAFAGFAALETVTFADGSKVASIGKNAFAYCRALTTVKGLTSTLKTLDTKAFYNCNALETIDLSKTSITTIATDTFTNTTSLTSIKFPKEITTISASAFTNTGAMDLVIPASVEVLLERCFYWCDSHCESLERVTFDSNGSSLVRVSDSV